MTLSNDTLNRLKYALARPAAANEIDALLAIGVSGTAWFVDGTNGADTLPGTSWAEPFATVQKAINSAAANDAIYVAPGDYNEAITITKDSLTLIGVGNRGDVAVAPSATNGIAILVDGTTSTGRVEDVTLSNIGGEGKGTGGGLHVKGNIRRFRAYGCKFEGGAFAAKLESTGADPLNVGDTRFEDCEFAWATVGLSLVVSGAGDPVTQTYVRHSLFHNITADCVLTDAQCNNIWLDENVFSAGETGTEPTQYLDIDNAGVTGFVTGNKFATSLWSTAKFAIAAGVLVAGNYTEAESGGGNASGTTGRPDA